MKRKELESLLSKLDYMQLSKVDDKRVIAFDTGICNKILDVSLQLISIRMSKIKSLDDKHRIVVYQLTHDNRSNVTHLQRKINAKNDCYIWMSSSLNIRLDTIRLKFDCLHDKNSSDETMHKISTLKEQIEMLRNLKRIENI